MKTHQPKLLDKANTADKSSADGWTAQLVRYGIVGIFNTAIFTGICLLGMRWRWHYAAYTLLAYAVAIGFSFVANRRFTFRQRKDNLWMLARFALVCAVLVELVEAAQLLLIDNLKLPQAPVVFGCMVVYTLVGFVLNKFWVFGT